MRVEGGEQLQPPISQKSVKIPLSPNGSDLPQRISSRDMDYQASSPDEKALVEACAKVGFIYTGDDNDIVTVKVQKMNIQVRGIHVGRRKNSLTFFNYRTLMQTP